MKPDYIKTAEYIQDGDKLIRIVRDGEFIYYRVTGESLWDGMEVEDEKTDG